MTQQPLLGLTPGWPAGGAVDPELLIRPISNLEVTQLAGVSDWWRVKGRDHGVIHDPATGMDVVPLRAYAYVSEYPRPAERRGRNMARASELRYRTVAERVRGMVMDETLTEQATLWVLPDGEIVTALTLEQRTQVELRKLDLADVALRIPIGRWICRDLPIALTDKPSWIRMIAARAA